MSQRHDSDSPNTSRSHDGLRQIPQALPDLPQSRTPDGRSGRIAPRIPNARLTSARLGRGWTQEELAAEVIDLLHQRNISTGIDADYISRLERGLISWPARTTRQALEHLFGFSAVQLGFTNRRLGGPHRRGHQRPTQLDGVIDRHLVRGRSGRTPQAGVRSMPPTKSPSISQLSLNPGTRKDDCQEH
uniref:helix-turn-helix domain-containing protein n=1 Tax=Nocardia suismassiliense TaxID=2077092 RepID=UPI003F498218